MNFSTQHHATTKKMIGHIRFIEKHLTKDVKIINLEMIPVLYTNIDKWISTVAD